MSSDIRVEIYDGKSSIVSLKKDVPLRGSRRGMRHHQFYSWRSLNLGLSILSYVGKKTWKEVIPLEEFKRGRPHKALYKYLDPRASLINRVRHLLKNSKKWSFQILIRTIKHPLNLIINGASTNEVTI